LSLLRLVSVEARKRSGLVLVAGVEIRIRLGGRSTRKGRQIVEGIVVTLLLIHEQWWARLETMRLQMLHGQRTRVRVVNVEGV
jgi:hypothetical protein